ncbi:MAG: 3'-5' exonuclease [Desulfonatronovibrio sp.]|nr:hypothetical protein [Desulfovibrionales bacterium]
MFIRSKIRGNIIKDWQAIMAARKNLARDQRLKDFYDSYYFPPKIPIDQVSYVAIDFETTGLNPETDDIISIGIVPFSLEKIYCAQAAQWLVSPSGELYEQSITFHGITHSDLAKAPGLMQIIKELLGALSGKIIVVHCHQIERGFLNKALMDGLGEGIFFPVIDTMAIESTIQAKTNGGLLNRLRGRKPATVRLSNTRERYGLPEYRLHHALTDALATAELFQAQIAHHFPPRKTWLASLLI